LYTVFGQDQENSASSQFSGDLFGIDGAEQLKIVVLTQGELSPFAEEIILISKILPISGYSVVG
jgi:hypothetical protein